MLRDHGPHATVGGHAPAWGIELDLNDESTHPTGSLKHLGYYDADWLAERLLDLGPPREALECFLSTGVAVGVQRSPERRRAARS